MNAHGSYLLPALLLAALGCATSNPCTPVLQNPGELRAAADTAVAERDFELAYRYLALIHTLHPQSAQSRDAFPLAAQLFHKNHSLHRSELDSIWVTSEPRFMVAWLATFFRDGGEFPQAEADALFLGQNYALFRDFLAYAAVHPRLSQWTVTAIDDNGVIEQINAVPVTPAGT